MIRFASATRGLRAGVAEGASSHPRLAAFGWMLVYLSALDATYQYVFSTAYYYALNPPAVDFGKLIESVAMLAVVVAALPMRRDRISTYLVWLLVLVADVPQLAIYAMRSEDRLFMWATTAFWVLLALLVRALPQPALGRRTGASPRNSYRAVIALYLLVLAVAAVVLIAYTGVNQVLHQVIGTGVDLSGAYANRRAFVAAHLPLNGYYFHWLALVFNPTFFAIAVMRRRWWAVVLIMGVQLMVAGLVGMRSYFFALFFAGFVGWAAGLDKPLRALSLALAAIAVGGAAYYYATGDSIVYLFFTGRFLLDAAQLNFVYYWFFSQHGPIPLAYPIQFYLHLPYPGTYPYAQDPAITVAIAYFHQNLAAVGGLVADAYMNFGLAGLALWALVVAGVGRVLDACAEGVDPQIAAAMLAMVALAMADTYLVRVFFTTGLIWAALLLYLMPRAAAVAAAKAAKPDAVPRRWPRLGRPRPAPPSTAS